MNPIPEIQNSQKQLERLAAQRELYSSAKKLHISQIILTVVIPVILAIIALFAPSFSVVVAIFGVGSFLFDITFLEPVIKKRKTKAAKIQELFDCEVLQIPASPLKVADDITVEEVLIYYDAHAKIASNIEKIRDWYPVAVGDLPLYIGRLVCQRANCWWDSKLRTNYSTFLKYMASGLFVVIIGIGLIKNLTLIEVTLIASGLLPFFQFCIKQHNDNVEAATRLNNLVTFSHNIWEKMLSGVSEGELQQSSRKLQDEIFEHRKSSPLILNTFYWLFRDKDEQLMNRSTEMLTEEAQDYLARSQNV